MMNMKRKLLGAVALFAMFGALEANAQQTRDLVVTAEVPEVCVINSPAQICTQLTLSWIVGLICQNFL